VITDTLAATRNMLARTARFGVVLFLLTALHGVSAASENALPDANGLTHWLYTPTAQPVVGKTYWLVVGVHGAGGDG
jgi:poly(3-hydroxybutyrate) depolymerase